MTDLNALIERLSRATEGSREADAEIFRFAFDAEVWSYHENCHIDAQVRSGNWANPREEHPDFDAEGDAILTWRYRIGDGPVAKYGELPRLTESIDAAMMLVPEGYAIRDWMVWPGHPVELTILETFFDKGQHWHNSDTQRWAVKASTPAIALCIAALSARTRAATGESGAEDHSIQKAGIDAEQSVTKPSPAWREDLETSLRAWDAYDANCTPEKIVEQANSMAKAIRAFLQADSKHGAA